MRRKDYRLQRRRQTSFVEVGTEFRGLTRVRPAFLQIEGHQKGSRANNCKVDDGKTRGMEQIRLWDRSAKKRKETKTKKERGEKKRYDGDRWEEMAGNERGQESRSSMPLLAIS